MDYRQPIVPAVVVLATAGAMSLCLRRGKSDGLAEKERDHGSPGAGGSMPKSATLMVDGAGPGNGAR
jgi:hypothetical protein